MANQSEQGRPKQLVLNKRVIPIDTSVMEMKLVDYLRDAKGLTGTKNGCGLGACGVCTILVDDMAVKSCLLRVREVIGKSIVTIEGMAFANGSLHPLQTAFIATGAIQCGFCTPGMVLTAHSLLMKNNHPTSEEIRQALKGNLCRCTGYQQIIEAVERAAPCYRSKGKLENEASDQVLEDIII